MFPNKNNLIWLHLVVIVKKVSVLSQVQTLPDIFEKWVLKKKKGKSGNCSSLQWEFQPLNTPLTNKHPCSNSTEVNGRLQLNSLCLALHVLCLESNFDDS